MKASPAGPRPERSGLVGCFLGPAAQGLSRCGEGQRRGGSALGPGAQGSRRPSPSAGCHGR